VGTYIPQQNICRTAVGLGYDALSSTEKVILATSPTE